jgi:hypothetical protein
MRRNIGTVDKVIRILVALAVVILYFINVISGTSAIILLIISGILVVTGILSICPLYLMIGVNTRENE